MDRRFFNLFNLNEAQSIELLQTPLEQLDDPSERYVAAAQLAYFPTETAIDALIEATQIPSAELYNRITRRKAVESLGKLKAAKGLSAIRACLSDEDCYTVENAVWAIGEIGAQGTAIDPTILEEIAQLLETPDQTYRVIIQTLTKLNYHPATDRIRPFVQHQNQNIAGVAVVALARFTGDYSAIHRVIELLQHPNVEVRRSCVQDLIDANYPPAIPDIAAAPISLVFRLRAIRQLAELGRMAGMVSFQDVKPYLEQVIRDHPGNLNLIHQYDQTPTLDFLIEELYNTDFGRCYLGSKMLLELYPDQAPAALLATYREKACSDYGANYHVIKLLGWLQHEPACELMVEAVENTVPQFQKSRVAGVIALAQLGRAETVPLIKAALETEIFELKYASLMALEQLGCDEGRVILTGDSDWLIQAKANR
ncbi:MAG: HEAT repeat domain-containing protein [Microcoleaceae cyanobacterium]